MGKAGTLIGADIPFMAAGVSNECLAPFNLSPVPLPWQPVRGVIIWQGHLSIGALSLCRFKQGKVHYLLGPGAHGDSGRGRGEGKRGGITETTGGGTPQNNEI